jgi:hypothetical protein
MQGDYLDDSLIQSSWAREALKQRFPVHQCMSADHWDKERK